MRCKLLVLAVLLLIAGCHLPNPYSAPTKPKPVPGSGPNLPTPTPETRPPEQTPAPVETPPQAPPQPPPSREYQLGSASKSLVTQARTQTAAGNYAVAAESLERALRIEPNNPLLWIEMGKLRLAENNFAQAENMGRKALSLATGDASAQSAAWQVIAQALRGRGRVQEAREAEAQANQLAAQ